MIFANPQNILPLCIWNCKNDFQCKVQTWNLCYIRPVKVLGTHKIIFIYLVFAYWVDVQFPPQPTGGKIFSPCLPTPPPLIINWAACASCCVYVCKEMPLQFQISPSTCLCGGTKTQFQFPENGLLKKSQLVRSLANHRFHTSLHLLANCFSFPMK